MSNNESNNRVGHMPKLGELCSLCKKPLTAASYGTNMISHVVCCVPCDRMEEWPNLMS